MSNPVRRDKIDRSNSYQDDRKGYTRPAEEKIVLPPGYKDMNPWTPQEMSPFEKKMVVQEKEERLKARNDYVAGITGIDGGAFPTRDF